MADKSGLWGKLTTDVNTINWICWFTLKERNKWSSRTEVLIFSDSTVNSLCFAYFISLL